MKSSFVVTSSCSKHGLSQPWGVDCNEFGSVCSSGKLKESEFTKHLRSAPLSICMGSNSLCAVQLSREKGVLFK